MCVCVAFGNLKYDQGKHLKSFAPPHRRTQNSNMIYFDTFYPSNLRQASTLNISTDQRVYVATFFIQTALERLHPLF